MNKTTRHLLILISLLLFLFHGTEVLADQLIIPGERMGNIYIGMKRTEMIKMLGQPDKPATITHEGFKEYQYMEKHLLMIDIDPKTDRIKYIATGIGSIYSTKSGLKVGIPAKSVTDIMGGVKPVKIGENAYTMIYPKQGIEFIVRKKNNEENVFIVIIKAKKE